MELSLLEICLLTAAGICLLIQLCFGLFVHLKLARISIDPLHRAASKPLSVVICARNEAANLQEFLPTVLNQDYPEYEVVVVNDRSWDGTRDLLEEFSRQYSRLKVVHVPDGEKFMAGKKFALTMGIKAASHDWLVFTDADCKPASDQWLLGMQQPADDRKDFLLGYSPYFKKKGLLNSLIRFETFFTAVNYLSFALSGTPYMGVGRNMAYKKSLFFRNKGFASHMHIPSGDDDLFVNAHATSQNVQVQLHRDTHVWSEPKTTWMAYLRQKKRHLGAGKMYRAKHKFVLSLQITAQFLFYILVAVLLCFRPTHLIAAGMLLLSILLRSLIYPRLLKRLNYPELRWWFPVLDMLLFIFLVFNGILSIFVKKVQWK